MDHQTSRWHQFFAPVLSLFSRLVEYIYDPVFHLLYIYICPSIARKLAIFFLHRADPVERDGDGMKAPHRYCTTQQDESPNLGAQFMDTIHPGETITLYIYEDIVSMIFNHRLFMITSYII